MKCPVKRIKIQTTDWEKILPNHSSDNGLLSRIYIKNPQNSTVKNQQLKKKTTLKKRYKWQIRI